MLVPLNKAVNKFWDKHEKEVFPWFKERKRYAVVISASPDFLLCEIKRRLKFETLICTKHNPKTGAIIGLNCRDEEKVRRFRELFPDAEVTDVYSDSLRHDRPIFSLGKRCFHIVKGERREFNYESVYGNKKINKVFYKSQGAVKNFRFLRLLFAVYCSVFYASASFLRPFRKDAERR